MILRIRLVGGLGLWRIRRGLGLAGGPRVARVRLGRRGLTASSIIGPVTVATRRRRRPRTTGRGVSIPGIVFTVVVVGTLLIYGLVAGGR